MQSAIRHFFWVGVVVFVHCTLSAQGLVVEGAEVRLLQDGFQFTEGPAGDRQGNLYFCDNQAHRIYTWTLDGQLKVFRENSGRSSGLYFGKSGHLYISEGGNRRIGSVSPAGEYAVVADRYQGKSLNGPNDLWVDSKGGIYFSDRASREPGALIEQDGNHIYYITPDTREVKRVIDDVERPNGLIGTRDDTLLYATDRAANAIYVWDIEPDGSLSNKRFFCEGDNGSDGMTMDELGNVYITTDAVEVFNPKGEQILQIEVPQRPRNVTFAGKDGRTLFITALTGLYALEMTVQGQ